MKIKHIIITQKRSLLAKLLKVGYRKLTVGIVIMALTTTGVLAASKTVFNSNKATTNQVDSGESGVLGMSELISQKEITNDSLSSTPKASISLPTPTPLVNTPTSLATPTTKPESANSSSPTPLSSNQVLLKANFEATGFRNTSIFSYTTQIFKGDTVSFDAGKSTGNVAFYEWDFGDGTTGVGKIIKHSYNTDLFNNYNVRLTVKSNNGQTDTTGGYYIHYIGEPRMLISVEPIPEANERKYVCGQTIGAKANTYSPYGEITQLEWEFMRGAISSSRESDKILTTRTTDKTGIIQYFFGCNTVLEDATLQNRDRNAVYSFVVRKMTDSQGNKLIYSNNNYSGGIGSLAIVVYNP